ncbi:MAG: ATP-dependent helicase, partial [Sphingomonas sp.]
MGFLLADEVGVGKTISAWDFVLHEARLARVLVVTTASAVAHWRNTIQHTGDGGKEVLILNYDRLGKLFDVSGKADLSTRRKGKRKRLATKGEPETFDVVIFDEAHKGKNLTSARSVMMRRLGGKAKFVIWASATAGQNPLELAYLAPLLAQVTGHRLSDLSSDFEAWCKEQDIGVSRGQFGRWEWRKST